MQDAPASVQNFSRRAEGSSRVHREVEWEANNAESTAYANGNMESHAKLKLKGCTRGMTLRAPKALEATDCRVMVFRTLRDYVNEDRYRLSPIQAA